MRGALQKNRKGFGSVGARCRPQLFPKEQFPFAEPEGCRARGGGVVVRMRGVSPRLGPPAIVMMFLRLGLAVDTCQLPPGTNGRDERDRLLRPLPRAEDTEGLAPAVATFANLQIVFFARAWPELSARLEP